MIDGEQLRLSQNSGDYALLLLVRRMDAYKSVSSIVCVCVLFREFVLLPYLWASGEEFPSVSFFWFLDFDSCCHTHNFAMKNNVREISPDIFFVLVIVRMMMASMTIKWFFLFLGNLCLRLCLSLQ
jgi:hypothetical protein